MFILVENAKIALLPQLALGLSVITSIIERIIVPRYRSGCFKVSNLGVNML